MASVISGDHIVPLAEWLPLYQGLLVVAGPCSVESREQLATTAKQLADTGTVSVLRAGVWKPRSRPGCFEGRGAVALPWLRDIKAETGLPVAVEVARPGHAELCLKHDVDMFWLGARTTVNPFMVQEIAQVISGTGMPVMIKNPVCPDLRLWIGAIERIMQAGTQKIIAIHRGFQTGRTSLYRNDPMWDIPVALQQEMPQLPVICDPSHIAGDVRWIAEVANKALPLQMQGLMIETHFNPSEALTDPLQQMKPMELTILLEKLLKTINTDVPAEDQLERLRRQIDEQDQQLLEKLACRLALSRPTGMVKRQLGAEIIQPRRQKDLFQDRRKRAEALGMSPDFVERFFTLLHDESVAVQSRGD